MFVLQTAAPRQEILSDCVPATDLVGAGTFQTARNRSESQNCAVTFGRTGTWVLGWRAPQRVCQSASATRVDDEPCRLTVAAGSRPQPVTVGALCLGRRTLWPSRDITRFPPCACVAISDLPRIGLAASPLFRMLLPAHVITRRSRRLHPQVIAYARDHRTHHVNAHGFALVARRIGSHAFLHQLSSSRPRLTIL
jgi:hypothetical protein